jgi:hypothetical protein
VSTSTISLEVIDLAQVFQTPVEKTHKTTHLTINFSHKLQYCLDCRHPWRHWGKPIDYGDAYMLLAHIFIEARGEAYHQSLYRQ